MSEVLDINELVEMVADVLKVESLPDPIEYQYWKNYVNRNIILNDTIGQNFLEMAVLPFKEMDNDGTGKPIHITVNSLGGEVYNGFALVDAIEKAKSPVTIEIVATACSMAFMIAMAGKNNPNVKTICHPFSIGLMHSGYSYMEGTHHAVKDTFDFNQEYEKKIREFILTHSKIDEELYDKVERKEYWMDSNEMLRLGIVDEIV